MVALAHAARDKSDKGIDGTSVRGKNKKAGDPIERESPDAATDESEMTAPHCPAVADGDDVAPDRLNAEGPHPVRLL